MKAGDLVMCVWSYPVKTFAVDDETGMFLGHRGTLQPGHRYLVLDVRYKDVTMTYLNMQYEHLIEVLDDYGVRGWTYEENLRSTAEEE